MNSSGSSSGEHSVRLKPQGRHSSEPLIASQPAPLANAPPSTYAQGRPFTRARSSSISCSPGASLTSVP